MKVILLFITLGAFIKSIIFLPSATLPQYPVVGTVPIVKSQMVTASFLKNGMSHKMHYLKTGVSIQSEINCRKQQNFWGKGVPSKVRLPVHLVEWEKFRIQNKAKAV